MRKITILGISALLFTPLLLQGCATQTPRGTTFRPQLTAAEAATFTIERYFAQGGALSAPDGPWSPSPVHLPQTESAWRVAPSGAPFTRIQQAVNAAIGQHGTQEARIYIRIEPGIYRETVYIPEGAPPITLYGAGDSPEEVRIELAIDSQFSIARYRQRVNSQQQYREGDPAWYQYALCAGRTSKTIGTNCAAVVWSQSADFQLLNLSVANSLLDTVDGGTHQGVALRTDGDRVQLENVRLLGRQDTLYVNTSNRRNEAVTDRISRVYVKDSYVEGDVDYVFGRANAVFDNVHFHTVSTRRSPEAYVLAPNTLPDNPYGFLVKNSRFTGDGGYQGSFKAKLGRAWDQGAGKTGYLAGKTANGQVLIVNSTIDQSYDRLSPWGAAATTARPFRGNTAAERQLDDVAFNRLWEFNNHWQP
ncbi:TPA: putative acyl-CoA thioester hydrolase [Klebsiella michiganensis]|uniref:putative acyl-CoA thioester hydrolase n=1 Tax=Klebsiella TaxID=570 RepID=UPI00141C42E4|nr:MULTISPECIES: putative acyl-CoA thioester hydrolase [Klebsiella]ELS4546452.1 putative acyl-CoA thioester hydrolase [Klebsiella michiganensis]MBS6907694.1 putative acyl-CoA thioester hydrolase [Klebsiella sp.]MDM4110921.1 putative acyl-CoA thioester hydrolase [Klebsiella michiganensis]MDM4344903.1 putative acyl-CoA thioester hydrolase [Klebsiella michiganensis]MDM4350327.1 putative acyl-CoA thioester hydrolase [Klebsiella michiganensis]